MKRSLKRLIRLSLCTVALTLVLGKAAYAQPVGRHIFVPGNAQQTLWVPVKKGEVFNVTIEATTTPKHHFFMKAFGVLGIAAANYQTQKVHVPYNLLQMVLDGTMSFGTFVRGFAHELLHVKQAMDGMESHVEREFLAYVYSLTDTSLPPEDISDKAVWKQKLTANYQLLPLDKQLQYLTIYAIALNS